MEFSERLAWNEITKGNENISTLQAIGVVAWYPLGCIGPVVYMTQHVEPHLTRCWHLQRRVRTTAGTWQITHGIQST